MHIGIEAPGHAALGAAPPSEADCPSTPGVARACLRNLAILALWSWLFRPSLAHLAQLAGEDHLRSSAWALAGALALVLRQARLGGLRPRLDAPLRAPAVPMALTLGAALAWLANARWLDVNLLGDALLGLSAYGLLGLWLAPRAWRQGAGAALLVILALPFGHHLETFLGYPLRLATARAVQAGLAAAGHGSVGVDTILVFENGISHVDLPCSGVRSLWTGLLFLAAATWIERRRVGPAWLGLAGLLGLLLAAANFARVAVLVVLGQVAGWPLVAELLHLPLGALGFGLACWLALALLRRLPSIEADAWAPAAKEPSDPVPGDRARDAGGRPRRAVALLAGLSLMIVLYSPRALPAASQPPIAPDEAWRLPAALHARALPLEPDSLGWLLEDGADRVQRARFDHRGLRGSLLLVESRTWRAHHQPERCFEVFGLKLEASRPHLVDPGFPLRFVALGAGAGGAPRSASYWFQSAERSTDDYAARIWADLAPRRSRWVMVSILFDTVQEAEDPALTALYQLIHRTVAEQLAVAGAPAGPAH
ncbi:MAG: exosortase O [Chloroflexi bacterium]|nr:exosortase O [Chloroflexota bacterium]